MAKRGASDDNGNVPAMAKRRTGDGDDVVDISTSPTERTWLFSTFLTNTSNFANNGFILFAQ